MIQLTERLVMTADNNCYIVGEARQRAGRPTGIENPKYYTTAARAVQGALSTAIRMAVAESEVTTLREFIEKQNSSSKNWRRWLPRWHSGEARQDVVEPHEASGEGSIPPRGQTVLHQG